jgi:hypothetical protein
MQQRRLQQDNALADQNALAASVPLLQSDPQNAFATAAAKSPSVALRLLPVIKQMDDQKRAALADRMDSLGKIALTVKQYPDPVVRKAVARSMLSQMPGTSLTPDDIERGDWSDNGLNNLTNLSRSVDEIIAQGNTDRTFEQSKQVHADTLANQKATLAETVRGHNMTDARARETKQNTGYRLMTPEEKKAAGLPGEAAYQVNGDGKIDRVAGNNSVRPIPSAALAGIQANRRTMEKIDAAIAALKTPEGKKSVGYLYGFSDAANQRLDPKGVGVRAKIADIGSAKLHDRSGASVTITEAPRLQPFIPSVADRDDALLNKLENLRAEYAATTDETEAFYSPEAGYMSLPARGGGKPGNSGGKQVAAGVIDFNDLD